MPSTAVMALLELTPRTADVDGWSFQVGRRTRWDFTLDLADLAGVTAITVAIQTAPRDADDEYVTAKSLGPYSSADSGDEVRVSTEAEAAADKVTLPQAHQYLRAIVTGFAGSGDYQVEMSARAAFLDPQRGAHMDPLPKKLRTWTDGLERIIEEAEASVLDKLLGRDWLGRVNADINRPDGLDRIQRAIRHQAVLDFRRSEMERSSDASVQVSLRSLPRHSPDAIEAVDPMLPAGASAPWRGR